jgi:hypothetical protein
MVKPALFLAFANDPHSPIPAVAQEVRSIREALERAQEQGLCDLEVRESISAQEVFDTFENPQYRGRIAVFHYGGHANSEALNLGRSETLFAKGLASFLGRQEGLKLVFLNGCSTVGQVDELMEAGVKAVIATSKEIDDGLASLFAGRFYRSLARYSSIAQAYQTAVDAGKAQAGEAARAYRGVRDAVLTEAPASPGWPWEIYPGLNSQDPDLNWKLSRSRPMAWLRTATAGLVALGLGITAWFWPRTTDQWPDVSTSSSQCLVATVQLLLRHQAALNGQPLPKVDGSFNAQTESSIRAFQQVWGLEVTGKADDDTWNRLAIPLLPQATVPDLIRAIQGQLDNMLAYELEVDGIYGPDTLQAVTDFKRGIGLEPSGLVDLKTWQALVNKTASVACSRPPIKG